MSLIRIDSHAPGSEGWETQRRAALGGSEIAVVLGISPYESRFSLWHRKAGHTGPIPDSPVMEWGRRLESVILDKWIDEHVATLPADLDSGVIEATICPAVETGTTWLRDGWMLANPDAIATLPDGRRVVVEIKTARFDDAWESGPPPHYVAQVMWYLAVLDLHTAYVAVLIGGSDYREYVLERDAADEALMIQQGRAFLDSLESGERPDIDDSYATFQTVREMHPDIDGTTAELPARLAEQLIAVRRAHDVAKAEWQLHQSVVLDHMASARNATHPDGYRVAYRMARKQPNGEPGTPFLAIDRKALNP